MLVIIPVEMITPDQMSPNTEARFRPMFATRWTEAEWNGVVQSLADDGLDGGVVAGQNLIMGGPQKAMKTSVALDLVISVSSGVPFLNMFEVPRACPVAFVSGESGNATLREAAMAIAVSKRVRLSTELYLSFALPSLAIEEHLAVLENEIVEKGLGLMIVDPAYLALLDSVSSTVSPSSVFAMGPILRHYAEIGDRTGCTMALIHHTKKGMKTRLRLTLDDLSQAGFAEFARQWFLINRRAVLTDNTPHRLICTVGGSAGHFGHYDVDALDMREHVGRVWEVTASESTEESKKAKWVDNAKRRLVDALRSGPKTRTDLKNRFKRFDEPLQALLDEGEVILTEVIKNKRSYDAYALPVQTPESQFGETENV